MEIEFIITSFGIRGGQLERMIKNIRQYATAPMITVCCNMENPVPVYPGVRTRRIANKDILRKRSNRMGIHNSNYYKAYAALNSDADIVCVLDDDMKIVNRDFMNGFDLAERFGIAVPMNPRVHIRNNAVGEDTDYNDSAYFVKHFDCLPACNLSPMFVRVNSKRALPDELLKSYMWTLERKPCRGTVAFSKAMLLTGLAPLFLPEQWCVGRQNAEYLRNYHYFYRGTKVNVKPICLHWGQSEVREVFKNYEDSSL